jgi:hypothetical protein
MEMLVGFLFWPVGFLASVFIGRLLEGPAPEHGEYNFPYVTRIFGFAGVIFFGSGPFLMAIQMVNEGEFNGLGDVFACALGGFFFNLHYLGAFIISFF